MDLNSKWAYISSKEESSPLYLVLPENAHLLSIYSSEYFRNKEKYFPHASQNPNLCKLYMNPSSLYYHIKSL